MNNDLLHISLSQGKQFNTYQSKLKKNLSKPLRSHNNGSRFNREGFTTQRQTERNSSSSKLVTAEQEATVVPESEGYNLVLKKQSQQTTNQKDLDEFKQMQQKYDKLMVQYTIVQTYITNKNMANINRVSSNNPYLNKNILFTDGTICYVTNKGIAKPYASEEDYKNTAGKNGCPPEGYITLDISWSSQYVKGSMIPTKPPLIVGTPMIAGQSCGFEGDNIYVSKYLPNDVTPSYMGCFGTSENNDNMTFLGDKPSSSSVSIENGNFDSPVISNNSYKYITSNSEVPGWTFNGAVLLNNSSAWGYPISYPNGNQCVSLQNTTSISQIISLSSNNTYILSFVACGRNCCTSPAESNTINIELYDTNNKLVSTIYEVTPPINTWTNYSKSFNVSNTDNYQIKFSGMSSEDKATAIQNIALNADTTVSSGNYTYEDCKNAAIDNGYQFFALQNVNTNTSKGYCAVSNSSPEVTKYGEAFIPSKLIALWSSNTSDKPGNTATLNNTGSLEVLDSSGKAIYATPATTTTDSGYLGCYADKSSRAMPNTSNGAYYQLEKCKELAVEQGYKYYAGQNGQSDGSVWCAGSNDFTTATKYGIATNCINKDGIMLGGGWSNAIYSVEPGGDYYLILKDDGNMCIHRGTDPNNDQGQIWCSETAGKQQSANPNMVATKGKYGKNWMPTGSTLVMGDFISSTNGDLVLTMEDDGNLVLYTYTMESNCKKMSDGIMGGGLGANAAYDIQKVAVSKNMGLLSYIDSDSILKPYPDSMLSFSNEYQIYANTDAPGNDITSLMSTDESGCKTACNDNKDCAAYVYQGTTSTCWLKNKSVLQKQQSDGMSLGVRIPKINGSTKCSKNVVNVDTIQYENYVKGSEMSSDTQCNVSIVSQEDKNKLDSIKNELYVLGQDIVSKMESLYNKNNKVYEDLDMNAEQFKKDLEKYKKTTEKMAELESNNSVEGMTNYDSPLTMSDINGMLTDADLRVLQENYSYFLWSILAVGLLAITVNTMKK